MCSGDLVFSDMPFTRRAVCRDCGSSWRHPEDGFALLLSVSVDWDGTQELASGPGCQVFEKDGDDWVNSEALSFAALDATARPVTLAVAHLKNHRVVHSMAPPAEWQRAGDLGPIVQIPERALRLSTSQLLRT